jgi:hypothetical protein
MELVPSSLDLGWRDRGRCINVESLKEGHLQFSINPAGSLSEDLETRY